MSLDTFQTSDTSPLSTLFRKSVNVTIGLAPASPIRPENYDRNRRQAV